MYTGSVAEPQYFEPGCSAGLTLGCAAGGKPNCRYRGFNQYISVICPIIKKVINQSFIYIKLLKYSKIILGSGNK